MRNFDKMIRRISQQIVILVGVIGLTFAAGIDWAQAAGTNPGPANAMPSELHVIFLFLLALGVLAASFFEPRKRARAKGRARHPHSPRR